MYLYEHDNWTDFIWDEPTLLPLLHEVRLAQGRLLGRVADIGLDLRAEVEVDALSSEVVASSRIEGVALDDELVRSSITRQLGLGSPLPQDDTHDVDGATSVLLDAVTSFREPVDAERLCSWHRSLFPEGRSGLRDIEVGCYRSAPIRVVSGAVGHERTHYEALAPELVPAEMGRLLAWVNEPAPEPLAAAAVTHLWFLTIHPFADGNGRIARALTELMLARSDGSTERFYAMARYLLSHRDAYYRELERAQKGGPDVTRWVAWFLEALRGALAESERALDGVLERNAFWRSLGGTPLNERQRKVLFLLKGGFEGKLTAAKWAKLCKTSPDTALRDINDLIGKGVLEKEDAGGRSTSYRLAGACDGGGRSAAS